ncbi:MAG: MFS transporter [Chitinophagaceae bacterium]
MVGPVLNLYRNAFSGLSSSTWWLAFILLVNRSGTMVVPFMTIYLTQHHHYSISQAGIVMGLFGAGAVAGGYIGGKLTDKYGFYHLQLITLCGGGLMFIVLGQMNSYLLICIFTFLLSCVNEAFRPANSTAVAYFSSPENRTRSYSLHRLAINLGWALGGGLGGLLASFNYELLFWVDGFTNLGAAVLLWRFLRPGKRVHAQTQETTADPNASAYRDKFYLCFIVLVTLFAMCFFQIFTNLTVYFKQELHFSESLIGLLMALNGLIIAVIEMVLIYQLEGRRSSLSYITIGVTLCAFSYIMYNLLPGTVALAVSSVVILTFGEILSMPFMNAFWIARSNAHNRGQYAGLYTIAWALAQVMGPTFGALMAEHYGFSTLLWVIGALCMLAAVGFYYLRRMQVAGIQNAK